MSHVRGSQRKVVTRWRGGGLSCGKCWHGRGTRPLPDVPFLHVMRGLVERGVSSFVQAPGTVQPQVTVRDPCRARRLRGLAGSCMDSTRSAPSRGKLMTEGADRRLMLEQGYGHTYSMPGKIKPRRECEAGSPDCDPARVASGACSPDRTRLTRLSRPAATPL